MELNKKLTLAFSTLTIILTASLVVQYFLTFNQGSAGTSNLSLDEIFKKQDFIYGPQAWAPGAQQLPITPGGNVSGENKFYIMFVDLNATPDLLNYTNPAVEVMYSFTNLQGTAAFHVYGYSKASGCVSWTNKVDGTGSSGFYVTSSPGATSSMAGSEEMEATNYIYVQVANSRGAKFNSFSNNTYYIAFKSGGGLNAVHITTDPTMPNGEVVYSENVTGRFYVTDTGSQLKEDLILMVAVNGTLADNFELSLKSSV